MIGARFSEASEKTVFQIGIFLCLIFAINGLAVQLFELPLHVLKSVNEGFNAYFASRAMDGMTLYPRPPELLMNNYPPLSFYIIGPLGKLIGDYIIAGRIISVVSFLVIVALVGYIVTRQTRSKTVGVFAALYFAAVFSVFPGYQIGMNAPQLLGHAVMLAGFSILWFGHGRAERVLCGAVLMVIAGLIKPNIVALPLAVTIWLALSDRRQLYLWLAAAALSLTIAILAVAIIWGSTSIGDILSPRPISFSRATGAIFILRNMLPTLTMLLFLLFYPAKRIPEQKSGVLFCIIYVTISLLVAFLLFGGIGIGSNAAFDLAISATLTIGFLINELPTGQEKKAVIAALVVGQYFMLPIGIVTVLNGSIARDEQATRSDIAYLAAHSGKVICDDPSLCYWAKKDFLFDFFNLPLLYDMKKRDPSVFFDQVKNHEYSVIAMDKPETAVDGINSTDGQWFTQFQAKLAAYYRLDRQAGDHLFYVPK
jgi:hypothetical protein